MKTVSSKACCTSRTWPFKVRRAFRTKATGSKQFQRVPDSISQTLHRFLSQRGFYFIILGLIAAALLLRLIFLFIEYPELSSDPGSYFHNAKSLINSGTLDNAMWWGRDYVARFPYIFNYIWLLSVSMRVFGAGAGAVLFLNTLSSALSSLFLYLLLKSALKSHRIGLLSAALWFLSPVEIAYAVIPPPVLVVNTCLLASLLISYHLIKARGQNPFWLFALLLGIALGIANIFRPIMPVLIIALALVLVYLLIRSFSLRFLFESVGCTAIICIIMTTISNTALLPAEQITGYSGLRCSSSWSLFLGSNQKFSGRYNVEDGPLQWGIDSEAKDDFKQYDKELNALTAERYRSFSPSDFISHWCRKSGVLLAGPVGSIHVELRDFPAAIRVFYTALSFLCYPILLSFLFFFGLYRFIHTRTLPVFALFTLLVLLGLFSSHILLTEVMDRYFVPFMPLMFILGIWGIFLPPASPKSKKRKWGFSTT